MYTYTAYVHTYNVRFSTVGFYTHSRGPPQRTIHIYAYICTRIHAHTYTHTYLSINMHVYPRLRISLVYTYTMYVHIYNVCTHIQCKAVLLSEFEELLSRGLEVTPLCCLTRLECCVMLLLGFGLRSMHPASHLRVYKLSMKMPVYVNWAVHELYMSCHELYMSWTWAEHELNMSWTWAVHELHSVANSDLSTCKN